MKDLYKVNVEKLYEDFSTLIETTKSKVAVHVNTEFVFLNWNMGNRIK